MTHLLLFDANGFAHRAYHAFRPTQRADGMQTHAVIGFMSLLWRTLGRAAADPATLTAAVFDPGGKTHRHAVYSQYKSTRSAKPGLDDQLNFMREASRSLGVTPVEVPGFEADDVIASLATKARAQGVRTTIVSVDKDLHALVEDGVIELVDPVKRARILRADVEKKWGVPPALVPDMLAIMGDAADNIPGVPGFGQKTAYLVMKRLGGVADILKSLEGPAPIGITMKNWLALRSERPNLPIYRELVTLKTDVPVPPLDTLTAQAITKEHIVDLLRTLEADSQFDMLFGDSQPFRVTEPVKGDPYAWWRAELRKPGQKIPAEPQAGWYKRRLVQNGAHVACRIYRMPEVDSFTGKPTGKETLLCEVATERADPVTQWGYLASQPISESVYKHMIELARWAQQHSKKESAANPLSPIDWNTEPL